MISISESKGLEGSVRIKSQLSSSLNKERKTLIKLSRTLLNVNINCTSAVSSISLIVAIKDPFASNKSAFSLLIKL
ncbi:hypothetical protein D3C87_1403030 [compost metagenome]